jgi:hypothetical protein
LSPALLAVTAVLCALAEAVIMATAITKNNFFIVTNLISFKIKK